MRCTIGVCIGAVWMLAAAPVQAMAPNAVTFPGTTTSVRSPMSNATVFYVDPGPDRYGEHEFQLKFQRGKDSPILLDTFERSVDVSWSPSGKWLYINDHVGSNIGDCLMVNSFAAHVATRSMTDVVGKSVGRPKAPETPSESHYYVLCDRWLSGEQVSGWVAGHTDRANSHSFNHPFVYNPRTRRLVWKSNPDAAPVS